MKRCAVAGLGAIGLMVGAGLIHGGEDVTLIPAFRKEQAERLNRTGLRLTKEDGDFRVPVKAVFLGELQPEDRFDIIFLGLKSNDLQEVIPKLVPYLAEDGCLVSLQNGINEEYLVSQVGEKRVVAGTTFAGGSLAAPDHMVSHEGYFRIGEMNGTVTPRVTEIAAMLSHVHPAEATENIRGDQWDKLARVCLSVPSATISGLYLGSVFMEPRLQKLFALLALELFRVAEADGAPRETVEEKSREEWEKVLAGERTGLEGRVDSWPPGIVDAYTADMKRGRALEIGFTNGAVVRLGEKYGIPTPINRFLVDTVFAIEQGKEVPGFHQVEKALSLGMPGNQKEQ